MNKPLCSLVLTSAALGSVCRAERVSVEGRHERARRAKYNQQKQSFIEHFTGRTGLLEALDGNWPVPTGRRINR